MNFCNSHLFLLDFLQQFLSYVAKKMGFAEWSNKRRIQLWKKGGKSDYCWCLNSSRLLTTFQEGWVGGSNVKIIPKAAQGLKIGYLSGLETYFVPTGFRRVLLSSRNFSSFLWRINSPFLSPLRTDLSLRSFRWSKRWTKTTLLYWRTEMPGLRKSSSQPASDS